MFEQWKSAVDKILTDLVGFSSDDFQDWLWRDAFDAGMTPLEAVQSFVVDCEDLP